jgi:hypothetical protein
VTITWNEPKAALFLGQHVPTEHLMYVLEIDPPLDKSDEDGITMMPACSVISRKKLCMTSLKSFLSRLLVDVSSVLLERSPKTLMATIQMCKFLL